MNRPTLLRLLSLATALLITAFAPSSAFAQRGGGHGGGGHHGGGGGGFHGGGAAYRGGAYGGGYHGGGYRGPYHGGYYAGWRGGHWGYPGYGWGGGWGWGSGWGWGVGVSIGWGSYWPAYPYSYGYAPGYAAPYPYYPYGYYYNAAPANSASSDPPPENQSSDPYSDGSYQDNLPPQQSEPAQQRYMPYSAPAAPHYATNTTAAHQSVRNVPVTNNYSRSAPQQLPPLSPEVQNAVRALRAMPPSAREEQLSRYGSLTPEQVSIVRQIVGMSSY